MPAFVIPASAGQRKQNNLGLSFNRKKGINSSKHAFARPRQNRLRIRVSQFLEVRYAVLRVRQMACQTKQPKYRTRCCRSHPSVYKCGSPSLANENTMTDIASTIVAAVRMILLLPVVT